MSTKRIFDDMYLYLKQVNINYLRALESQGIDGTTKAADNLIDELNGMPLETY